MAGHSKWANIKHRKERADKKKGKVFSRLAKEIISAVKQGGADIKSNAKLRAVIQKAKSANLPNDIIERNIKKASSSDQSDYSEVAYDLYGHGGVGIIIQAMTDNKNRMNSDLRIATNKCGGNLATPGAVGYNFDHKGVIQVDKSQAIEEELFLLTADVGAEDFAIEDNIYIITTKPEDLYSVKEAIDASNTPILSFSLEMIPKTVIECSKADQEANQKLFDWIENLDDVDALYHNMG